MKKARLNVVALMAVLASCISGRASEPVKLKWRPDIAPGIYELQDVHSGEGLAWSPDGQNIAVLWDRMGYPDFCLGCKVGTEVAVINVKSLVKTALIKAEDRHVLSIAWLPDSKHLAYRDYTSDELRSVGIDGVDDGKLLELDGRPAWSPDGARIAVSNWEGGPPNWHPIIDIFDTRSQKRSTIFRGETEMSQVSIPSWSADGTRLAFVYGAYNSEVTDVKARPHAYILDLSTGQISLIGEAANEYSDAQFSPAENLVALSQWAPKKQLVLQDLSFGCSVTIPTGDGLISWAPDGRRMAVSSGVTTYLVNLTESLGANFGETGSICP